MAGNQSSPLVVIETSSLTVAQMESGQIGWIPSYAVMRDGRQRWFVQNAATVEAKSSPVSTRVRMVKIERRCGKIYIDYDPKVLGLIEAETAPADYREVFNRS